MQESFTDTIAFDQLFSGEIAGVIMEFFKKFKRRAGRQPIRQGGAGGAGCLSQARAAPGKDFHI